MATYLVTSGQTLSGLTLSSSDAEYVLPGGTASSTVINGGFQDDAGTATGTTIYSGAQIVESGGIATSTIINGGAQLVMSGGTATSAILNGGYQLVSSAGIASNTTLNGGSQFVEAGARATGATISGGYQDDFGAATGTII